MSQCKNTHMGSAFQSLQIVKTFIHARKTHTQTRGHTDAELILMETIQWKFCGTWDHNLLGFVYSNPNVERQALQRPPR